MSSCSLLSSRTVPVLCCLIGAFTRIESSLKIFLFDYFFVFFFYYSVSGTTSFVYQFYQARKTRRIDFLCCATIFFYNSDIEYIFEDMFCNIDISLQIALLYCIVSTTIYRYFAYKALAVDEQTKLLLLQLIHKHAENDSRLHLKQCNKNEQVHVLSKKF